MRTFRVKDKFDELNVLSLSDSMNQSFDIRICYRTDSISLSNSDLSAIKAALYERRIEVIFFQITNSKVG